MKMMVEIPDGTETVEIMCFDSGDSITHTLRVDCKARQVAEKKKWIVLDTLYEPYKCPVCGKRENHMSDYCRECGTELEEGVWL